MDSDVIEPKQLQIQITLAEENLLEQLDNLYTKVIGIINEVQEMFNDIFQDRLEIVKTRITRVIGAYRDLRNNYRGILEYASRVSSALMTANHYLNILNASSDLLEKIHKLYIHFSLVHNPSELNEDIIISAQKILSLLIECIDKLQNILRSYIGMPTRADKIIDDLSTSIQNLSSYYDESYVNSMREKINMLSVIIMDSLGDVVNSFIKIYEALLCLHVVKRK